MHSSFETIKTKTVNANIAGKNSLPEGNFQSCHKIYIGVRAGGASGDAAPPNFGQLRFFGQREKIWAKPVFKDVSILFHYFKDLNINLKSA